MTHFNMPFRGGENIRDVWTMEKRGLQPRARAQWSSIWATGTWTLWRERNMRTFSSNRREKDPLVSDTILNVHKILIYLSIISM